MNDVAMKALAFMCPHTGLRQGDPERDCFVQIDFLCCVQHMPVLLVRDSEGMVGLGDLYRTFRRQGKCGRQG